MRKIKSSERIAGTCCRGPVFEYREERVRKPTNRFNYGTLGGTNPTPPPAEPKKKPKWHKEEIKDNGSSDSFLTGGFLPILRL